MPPAAQRVLSCGEPIAQIHALLNGQPGSLLSSLGGVYLGIARSRHTSHAISSIANEAVRADRPVLVLRSLSHGGYMVSRTDLVADGMVVRG
jgi:hypothetical protein